MVVVLPAPFGPSSPYTVPGATARSTPASARLPPNLFSSRSASMASRPRGNGLPRPAGVSRQTIYAHFPTREALLDAIIERAAAEVTAAFDAAGLDDLPPAAALVRLLEAGWQAAARYPLAWHLPAVSPEEDASRHAPLLGRLLGLIERGQESGDLDPTLPPGWLLTACLALGRAAEEEVKAGRMTIDEATRAVHRSFLRLLGLADSPPG